jgi:hypothetical protein
LIGRRARVLITASGVVRGTKKIELKRIADQAIGLCEDACHQVRAWLLGPGQSLAMPARPMLSGKLCSLQGQCGWPREFLSEGAYAVAMFVAGRGC